MDTGTGLHRAGKQDQGLGEPGGTASQAPKILWKGVGSDGVLSCRQKPLGPSPRDASITQASPGGNAS